MITTITGPSDAQCVLSVKENNKLVEELCGCGYQLAFKYPDDEISSPPPQRYPLYHHSEEEEWEVISDDGDEVEEEMVEEVVVASNNSVELCKAAGLSSSI